MSCAEFLDRLGPLADFFILSAFFAVAAVVAGVGEHLARMHHQRRQAR